jgi:hypothetical protein
MSSREQSLFNVLKNPNWYSYSISGIQRLCNFLSLDDVYETGFRLNHRLIGDRINVFTYNDVVYMGLESRRIDYQRDKAAGTNKIERLIQLGVYDKKTNKKQ